MDTSDEAALDAPEATPPPVRERFRESAIKRLFRDVLRFASGLLRLLVLAAILTPILLFSFLTVDIPVYAFDSLFDAEGLKPSNWLSVGGLSIVAATPIAILITRKYGGDEASRALTASWGIAAIASFAGVSALAPSIEPSDMPNVRFVVAFVASAMIAQYLAVAIYDVTRGGGAWWRAPLISALIAFGAHSAIYFPWVYWKLSAPWLNWMVSDFAVKSIAAFAFLPVYLLLSGLFRPVGGYGGR